MNHSLVILAAGSGSRMNLGYNKMLHEIDGEMILNHTLQKFLEFEAFKEIIVVINPKDEAIIKKNIINDEKIILTHGQGERQDSVHAGVKLATGKYTLVHDGARMYISKLLITKILTELKTNQDAYAVAVAVKDSIRKVKDNKVVELLKREELFAMQTPQIAKTDILKLIQKQAIEDSVMETDEVGLLKHYGYEIQIIKGEYQNKKVTTIEDL